MSVLIAVASRHGATAELVEAVAEGLRRRGVDAAARNVEDVTTVDGFDGVVIGSAVYMGRWLKPARQFVAAHADQLQQQAVWLISSGPLGEPGHLLPEADAVDVEGIVRATDARGNRVFPGRLDRSLLSFREKAVVGALHAPEGDFRDWQAVDAFAGEIVAEAGS